MAVQDASQYGGFWIRVLASLVDNAILWIGFLVIGAGSAALGDLGGLVGAAAMLLLALLYFPLMHASARQATLGKALLGMKVVNANDGERISIPRALGRDVLGKFVSSFVLMLGFVMAAFTGRKQALHDKLASTVVVREGPGHVVAALLISVFSLAAPALIVLFVGTAVLAGVLGGVGIALLSGGMTGQEKQVQKTVPAPAPAQPAAAPAAPVPAAPAAPAGGAEALFNARLEGMDKPGMTRAGPAVLQLDTFFTSNFWIRVYLPPQNEFRSGATVTITRITDTNGADVYDPKQTFESEFFQRVSVTPQTTPVASLAGIRTVHLKAGASTDGVRQVDGSVKLSLPVNPRTETLRAADIGKEKTLYGVGVTLLALQGTDAEIRYQNNPGGRVVSVVGYGADGKPIVTGAGPGSRGGTKIMLQAPAERIEVTVAESRVERAIPFTLTRAGAPAAPAGAKPAPAPAPAPVAAKPAPAPVPVKAAPAPAPEKLAAAPFAEAPKPKPAPRKRVAVAKPAAAPVAAAAPVRAPLAVPAPRTIAAPKYSDLMSAVLNRDTAGVQELLDFGKWADKPDRRGTTPLMVAAGLGDTASAEALLKAGADAEKAMPVAQEKGDKAMIALLQRYGATLRRP